MFEEEFEKEFNELIDSIYLNQFSNDVLSKGNYKEEIEKHLKNIIIESSTFEESEKKYKLFDNSDKNILKENEDIMEKNKNQEKLMNENINLDFDLENQKKKNENDNNEELKDLCEEKKKHDKWSKDNMMKKYKIYILNFGIDLLNDCIKMEKKNININDELKYLNQELISSTDTIFNKYLLNLNLDVILSNDISKKYKKYKPNHNKIKIELLKTKVNEYPKTYKLLKKSFSELCGIYNNLNNEAEEYGLNQAQTFDKFLLELKNKYEEEYIIKFRDTGLNFVQKCLKTKERKRRKYQQ